MERIETDRFSYQSVFIRRIEKIRGPFVESVHRSDGMQQNFVPGPFRQQSPVPSLLTKRTLHGILTSCCREALLRPADFV